MQFSLPSENVPCITNDSSVQCIIKVKISTQPKVYFLLKQSALSSARPRFTKEHSSAQAKDSSLRNQSAALSLIIVRLRSWPRFLRLPKCHTSPNRSILSWVALKYVWLKLSSPLSQSAFRPHTAKLHPLLNRRVVSASLNHCSTFNQFWFVWVT